MEEIKENALSLLTHCKTCQSSCCHDSWFAASAKEHKAILKAGYPDHFTRVGMRFKNYYVLDFRGKNCSYRAEDGRCSIEAVKPAICQSYPAGYNAEGHLDVNRRCPAACHVTQEFLNAAQPIIDKRLKEIPEDVHMEVLVSHCKKTSLKNNGG